MSSESDKLSGLDGLDPKEMELVVRIINKTQSGKIRWERTSSSLVANIPGMQLSFVRSPTPALNALSTIMGVKTSDWELFSIRSPGGAEIFKVEAPAKNVLTGTSKGPRTRLIDMIDELYAIADSKGKGDIDKAIDVIKNL